MAPVSPEPAVKNSRVGPGATPATNDVIVTGEADGDGETTGDDDGDAIGEADGDAIGEGDAAGEVDGDG